MKSPIREVLPIIGILLVAFLLRYYHLSHGETAVEQIARHTYAPAGVDRADPSGAFARGLYPAIASVIFNHFDLMGVRFLSVFAGVGCVLAVFGVAGALFDRRVGLVAASAVAVSPHLVYQSQLATSSAVATFLAISVVACHFRAVAAGGWGWRAAYLAGFGALAGVDCSGFAQTGSQTTGQSPVWGAALLVLAALVVADLLRAGASPISRWRVATAYLAPVVLLSPFFAYTLSAELQSVPEEYAVTKSLFRHPNDGLSILTRDRLAHFAEQATTYRPALGEMANVFVHHLVGHGQLTFQVMGRTVQVREKLEYVCTGLLAVCLVATCGSIRLRRPGDHAVAMRLRVDARCWTGLKSLMGFLVVAPAFAFLLQWFAYPRRVDFHLLVAASGCVFLVVMAAGIDRLLRSVWTTIVCVLPLGVIVLLGLRKSYQLLA